MELKQNGNCKRQVRTHNDLRVYEHAIEAAISDGI